ncbi:MAG: IS982 family transposase [Candidatus Marinimicrobia bacterium]|nr:IS982 family transposase [Candidatus Neomarinimicrobiota bacterium]
MNYLSLTTEIFVRIDDFMIEFNTQIQKIQLPDISTKKRNRKSTMVLSEVMTIIILFHLSSYRNFKHFYLYYIHIYMKHYFPNLVSYNRFVELMKQTILPMGVYLKLPKYDKVTGISFVDSTPIRVCKNKRISRNKVFKNLATVGKSTMGWFYGFKLHLVCNDKGDILNFVMTEANVDDRKPLIAGNLMKSVWGKLYADKGYIGKDLFNKLFVDGIQIITSIRKNMKNSLLSIEDKILLRKRSVIETINDELKNICQVEHSRHRSPANYFANLLAGLIAYSFFPKKPAIKYETQFVGQMSFC